MEIFTETFVASHNPKLELPVAWIFLFICIYKTLVTLEAIVGAQLYVPWLLNANETLPTFLLFFLSQSSIFTYGCPENRFRMSAGRWVGQRTVICSRPLSPEFRYVTGGWDSGLGRIQLYHEANSYFPGLLIQNQEKWCWILHESATAMNGSEFFS